MIFKYRKVAEYDKKNFLNYTRRKVAKVTIFDNNTIRYLTNDGEDIICRIDFNTGRVFSIKKSYTFNVRFNYNYMNVDLSINISKIVFRYNDLFYWVNYDDKENEIYFSIHGPSKTDLLYYSIDEDLFKTVRNFADGEKFFELLEIDRKAFVNQLLKYKREMVEFKKKHLKYVEIAKEMLING